MHGAHAPGASSPPRQSKPAREGRPLRPGVLQRCPPGEELPNDDTRRQALPPVPAATAPESPLRQSSSRGTMLRRKTAAAAEWAGAVAQGTPVAGAAAAGAAAGAGSASAAGSASSAEGRRGLCQSAVHAMVMRSTPPRMKKLELRPTRRHHTGCAGCQPDSGVALERVRACSEGDSCAEARPKCAAALLPSIRNGCGVVALAPGAPIPRGGPEPRSLATATEGAPGGPSATVSGLWNAQQGPPETKTATRRSTMQRFSALAPPSAPALSQLLRQAKAAE